MRKMSKYFSGESKTTKRYYKITMPDFIKLIGASNEEYVEKIYIETINTTHPIQELNVMVETVKVFHNES